MSIENDEHIVIAHPSLEVTQYFLSLGFRETVIKDNQLEDKNMYLISGKDFLINKDRVLKYEDKTIIFNEQDKILIQINERWNKKKIANFVQNPETPKGLYQEIKGTLKQYIEFPKESVYGIVTAWIISTYFHREFNAFPFLFIYGKKQSGKSRFLDLLERLSFNAMKIKGVSVASLADSIDGIRGTFLNDQAEELSNKKNTEILGILSDSYTIGGGKRRIVERTNQGRRLMEFETYGPKAFASIKEIDSDLKDRCIEITMLRAIKEYPYPEPYLPLWGDLRDKLYRLLLTRWTEARELYQDTGKDLLHRVRELWRPLETVLRLENVSGEEIQGIKGFFLESMQETQHELTEHEIKLMETLKKLLQEKGKDTLTVTEIAEKIDTEFSKKEDKEKRRVTTWIGKMIKQLSLYSKHAGRKDGKTAYEFSYSHIENICQRYSGTNTRDTTQDNYLTTKELCHNSLPDNDYDNLTTENSEREENIETLDKEIEI